jgi:amino acid adenylation domain-containing protein
MNTQQNAVGIPDSFRTIYRNVELPPVRSGCTRRACIPQLVSAAAAAMPNAIALSMGQDQLSYGELDARADRLARHLAELGVGPEVTVGISLERSFDYVVAVLAVWKAGGAYVPVDLEWPEERRMFVFADAKVAVTIGRGLRVDLDRDAEKIARATGPVCPETKRENLAYVIYTSGSSGRPKGVEVTHGNLLNLIFWHRRTFGVTTSDRASHVAGLAFDAAVWELWPYLSAGASVALADETTRTSPDLLRAWLAAEGVTISFVPTTLAEPMLQAEWPKKTALRYLLTGADTLHRYPSTGLPFQLVNNYGPTECTVVATSGIVKSNSGSAKPAIGWAIANTQIYLLNENRDLVAIGETGEIYIGGTSVARGYRNEPQLTADRFVTNPFSPAIDARMYRTGDLGVLLPDGQISFQGRADQQEKIRGHRIEPDEIVSVLARHPHVLSAAVAARGENCAKHLVAYVVPGKEAPRSYELREFLSRELPEYMIPSCFVRIAALPLTANGKLDRAALPGPTAENALDTTPYRAPESPIEKQIAEILAGLLHVDRVGLEDNFFLLGGHSLLGTQLVLRARERFGVTLTLRDLFAAQTVGKLCNEIERQLIDRLDAMSEEEAGRLLAQMEK